MTKSKRINNGRPNTAQKTKRFSNMIPTENLKGWAVPAPLVASIMIPTKNLKGWAVPAPLVASIMIPTKNLVVWKGEQFLLH